MTSSSPNSRANKAKTERAAQDAQDERTIIQSLMSHPAGRRWLWNWLSWCEIFQPLEDVTSHSIMSWREGRRNAGLRLYSSILKHSPNEWVRAINESSSANLNLNEEDDNDDRND